MAARLGSRFKAWRWWTRPIAQAWSEDRASEERTPLSGKAPRRKGDRIEREIINLHEELDIHAERYPLSGASHFRGSGHDIDIYADDDSVAPLVAEVKSRKDGKGFTTLEKWLGDYDLLFLRRDRKKPLVVMPWRVYAYLMGVEEGWQPEERKPTPGEPSAKREPPEDPEGRSADGRA